jgi:hypothetical protein
MLATDQANLIAEPVSDDEDAEPCSSPLQKPKNTTALTQNTAYQEA